MGPCSNFFFQGRCSNCKSAFGQQDFAHHQPVCSSKYGAHSKLLSAEEVEILLRSARKRQRTNASNEVPVSTEVHRVQPAVEQIQISLMMSRTNEMGSEEFDESRSRGELSENMNLVSEGNSIFLECGLILVFLAENSNSLPEGMDFDSSDDEENLDSTCEGEFSTLTPLFNHLIFFHLKNSMNLPELEAPLKNLQPLLMRNWRNFKKFSEKMK